MTVAFCDPDDVRQVLQKVDLSGAIDNSDFVQPAVEGASRWFARQTNGHWFDSSASGSIIDDTTASASDVVLDVPSSPHRHDRAIISDKPGVRYPVTTAGPYAEVVLPHLHVTSITKLEVRDRDGDVTDWVADSGFTSGRGNDYYLQSRGQDSYGRTYLYVDAAAIGGRVDFERLLTLSYDYGLDAATETWDDVKRGVANLAAAEVVSEDSVLAQIPDNGQLVGVQTQHQQLVDAADTYLREYISAMGANR